MPAIYKAYQDERMQNRGNRIPLVMTGLTYTGISKEANEMFLEVLGNDNIPHRMRAYAIENLVREESGEAPVQEPSIIEARLDVLEQAKSQIADEQILRSIQKTGERLEGLLNGESIDLLEEGNRDWWRRRSPH